MTKRTLFCVGRKRMPIIYSFIRELLCTNKSQNVLKCVRSFCSCQVQKRPRVSFDPTPTAASKTTPKAKLGILKLTERVDNSLVYSKQTITGLVVIRNNKLHDKLNNKNMSNMTSSVCTSDPCVMNGENPAYEMNCEKDRPLLKTHLKNGFKMPNLCSVQNSHELPEQIDTAVKALELGEIISLPTDTIYGIAGLAQNTEAVNRLYKIKGRDFKKPISICVGRVSEINRWCKVIVADDLLNELLPGAVTVVFERREELNPHLNSGTKLVGVRVPDYGFVQKIAETCGQPIALTSANKSEAPSTIDVQEFKELWPYMHTIFDGGRLDKSGSRLGSTVVDLSQPNTFQIIRPGSSYEETVKILTKHGLEER